MVGATRCAHTRSTQEVVELNAATDAGAPFLVFRDQACAAGDDTPCRQYIVVLPANERSVTIGRTAGSEVSLSFDHEVSRAHCTLERVGDGWALHDDGMSRNGSKVNGQRVRGRRVLHHDDRIEVGATTLTYRAPLEIDDPTGRQPDEPPIKVTDAQRRVLVELCRPFRFETWSAEAPSNQDIAAALFLAVETVKAHLRALFEALGVDELPQNSKRRQLALRAWERDLVSERDYES